MKQNLAIFVYLIKDIKLYLTELGFKCMFEC